MIFLLVFLAVALGFMITSLSGAPWVPVRSFDVQALLDDTKLKKGQTYLELGCGDGRLVKAAAKRGAIAIGYELNPLLWLIAWTRCATTKGAHVRFGDLWRVDLSKADVVMAFLVPRTMPKLAKKVAKELKPSAILVSYIFEIVGKKPLLHNKSWYIYSFKKSSVQKR